MIIQQVEESMHKNLTAFFIGIVIGVIPWIITPFVSDYFEPWDSEIASGFMLITFSITGFYLGFSNGIKSLSLFALGIYLISNIYPFVFGSSESRVWATLGLITNLLFCLVPVISGLFGKLSKLLFIKYKNKHRVV